MSERQAKPSMLPGSRARLRARAAMLATSVFLLGASVAAIALASTAATVDSTANAPLGETVLVDTHGHTLYMLSPETSRHLLCRSHACLRFWPPLAVRSHTTKLTLAAGLHLKLGTLRRSDGTFQVTVGGRPVYRYSGDHAAGEANGQGISSFGGHWHAVATTSAPVAPAPVAPAPTPPSPAPTPAATPTTTSAPTPPPPPPYTPPPYTY